ncbi:hypothetical protein JTE90_023412 [Oedothorax gibbosus]|uniref:RAD50-interacting protein 1 n=2 Tax=Oedothorax gibbosus TaxID=931172 RepID=A0AAV6TUK7_9ARAC|nr:hypothetical protein JTE90_023412 [Oedothorax gibbosus]
MSSVEVAEFFNSEFGGDLSNLNKLQEVIDRLSNYEEELEREVNPRNFDPENVLSFNKNAENALEEIKELTEKFEKTQTCIKSELETIKPTYSHFSAKIKEYKEIESLYCYLQWILTIEKQNSAMEEALQISLNYNIIDIYTIFKSSWEKLRLSECKNLVSYVTKTMVYWHDVLKEKFGSEFQKAFGNLHWPVSSTKLTASHNQSGDALVKFNQLFLLLCKVALPDNYIKTQDIKESVEDSSLLLPLQLMLQPLQKRFAYHFMGKKPTNRLDKPEWYLTQILGWISDHSPFLEKTVEPILQKEKLSTYSARILSSDPCFSRWRSLEHQSALEKMDKFLSLETAWKSRYQEESDLDDMHVPESAELFVTLLLTMTERYSNIADKDRQISFLDLQLELLDDFRLRLHQLAQCQMQETIQFSYCGIMNAIHYVTNVLEEWNNLPFFLHLYSYKRRKNACESLLRESEKLLPTLRRKESKSLEEAEEDPLENSVFDEAIGLFEHMQQDLLMTLCERVLLDIKAKSRPYRKEKWFCMPVPEDKKLMELSLAAYPMLEIVNSNLHSLQEMLAKPLFTRIWQQIAKELNMYIYEEVILQNNFSKGGALQFSFDMSRNLFPIFGSYTVKPENYFKLIRDSCVLLNLSSAPAMLLRETLKHQENVETKSSALEELGVYSLSPSQVLVILSQRNHTNL